MAVESEKAEGAAAPEGAPERSQLRRLGNKRIRRRLLNRFGRIFGTYVLSSLTRRIVAINLVGLVALGTAHPDQLLLNANAQSGDVLILGKPLGIGIYSAALKREILTPAHYEEMIASTTRLNTPGTDISAMEGVHAATDVTGFGLLGHLGAMARESAVTARVESARVPAIDERVLGLIEEGCVPGGTRANLAAAASTFQGDGVSETMRILLADAQTSGGLLLAVPPGNLEDVLRILGDEGAPCAEVIGEMVEQGDCAIEVR